MAEAAVIYYMESFATTDDRTDPLLDFGAAGFDSLRRCKGYKTVARITAYLDVLVPEQLGPPRGGDGLESVRVFRIS